MNEQSPVVPSPALDKGVAYPSAGYDGPPPRAFGIEAGDLDFDFESTDRLVLATNIVARCAHAGADTDTARLLETVWAMPVGARIARLLRITAVTEAVDALSVVLRCPNPDCGDTIEIDLPLERLVEEAKQADAPAAAPVGIELGGGKQIRLRHPTGNDQRAWRARAFTSTEDALLAAARSLLLPEPEAASIEREELSALAEAMEEVDPLAAFRVVTVCPHCGDEAAIAVDLEAEALRRLARAQRIVLHEVHTLARRYGWTEAETLAVPAKRRARYLRAIENEGMFSP